VTGGVLTGGVLTGGVLTTGTASGVGAHPKATTTDSAASKPKRRALCCAPCITITWL